MSRPSSSSSSSLDPHLHSQQSCPVTGNAHGFCPAQKGDSRSPCPALNTMANHGYINRDGKNLGPWHITQGLKKCYGLTTPFAIFLTYTTFLMLRKFRPIDLFEIGKHGVVEHDASLVHHDTPKGQEYAPIEIDPKLVEEIDKDATTTVEMEVEVDGVKQMQTQRLLSTFDVGRARVRREKQSPRLSAVHAEIARGEMAIILAVWEKRVGDKAGVPSEWIKRWLGEERLPDGWRPERPIGLFDTRKRGKEIKETSNSIWKAEREAALSADPNPKPKL